MTGPRPIQALADAVINVIAAGEVIERPASIVKELVENSLDAGAGRIRIELENGGIAGIVVEDDGHGIESGQLALALRRHCTSKLSTAAELARILSLGFRGEALASIAAVADVEIVSRAAHAAHAWRIHQVPGGVVGEPEPASRHVGTRVTVASLFAQQPVRRRFLRQAPTELLAIQQLLRGLAFCMPAVGFTLQHAPQRRWHAPPARDAVSAAARWRAVFGAEFARAARYVEWEMAGVRISGWVAPGAQARSQSDLQYLAVNGRLIRDRQLAHGVRVAFGDSLASGRHAAYALHLELRPEEVDVNVHPGKTEVRFRQVRDVHDLLLAATRDALRATTEPPLRDAYCPAAPAIRVRLDPRPRPAAGTPAEAASAGVRDTSARAALAPLAGGRFLLCEDSASGPMVCDVALLVRASCAPAALAGGLRTLAFPVRVTTQPGPAAASACDTWRALGFDCARLSPGTRILRQVPPALPDLDDERLALGLQSAGLAGEAAAVLFAAVAGALRVPVSMDERRDWIAAWCRRLVHVADAERRCLRPLAPTTLAMLFRAEERA
jgi:DNA mismatch repair protein MutL